MKVADYHIIIISRASENLHSAGRRLRLEVEQYLASGWQLHGPMIVDPEGLMQPVIRYEPVAASSDTPGRYQPDVQS